MGKTMNLNKYTEKAQEGLVAAQGLADREGHPEITPEHLLLTLLEQQDGIVPSIVRKMNADPAALAAAVRTEIGRAPRAHGGAQAGLSARTRQVIAAAEDEAARLKDEYVSTEHLFVAIAAEGAKSPGARPISVRTAAASAAGSAFILRTIDGTMPSCCSSRVSRRCSGVISGCPSRSASPCAATSASCAFSVYLFRFIVLPMAALKGCATTPVAQGF